jgi:aminopeptidase-like protein
LPDQPNAIPYITSYYKRRWGFCLTHIQRKSLKQGEYHVVIDSEIKPGVLNYADIVIPGKSKKEVMLSTYVCHPSMANNEISGPVVATMLAKWLTSIENRFYTYRIIFIPETIGSVVYLSKHLQYLKDYVVAGFNITCIGDDRCYSYLPSRNGKTLSDRVALYALKLIDPDFKSYTWLDRGSDERQFCSPGVDLPIASIMRSKYFEYPEYHTSLDDLTLITSDGLKGGFMAIQKAIEIIENNRVYKTKIKCEPQLGRRGLYPTLSTKQSGESVKIMMDFISYCDGTLDLLHISEIIGERFESILPIVELLLENSIIEEVAYE